MSLKYLIYRFCIATAMLVVFLLGCMLNRFDTVSVIVFALITIMMIVKAGLAYYDFQRRTDIQDRDVS